MAIAPSPIRPSVADTGPAQRAESVRVVPWLEATAPGPSFHVRSRYAERFWLPVLGPSALWLLRHLVERLESAPQGYDLDLQPTARALGLGGLGGRYAPFPRSILRCARFGALAHRGTQTIAVRVRLSPVPPHWIGRLPDHLMAEHDGWIDPPGTIDVLRANARRLALELVALFEDRGAVEAELHLAGMHPALANEAADWAVDAYQRLRCTTSSNGRRSGVTMGATGRSAGYPRASM